ncbi:MAG: FixH family protein [Bacteroidetes bacterium]|nr:FixH family protein [Bacteroidota bacterium]
MNWGNKLVVVFIVFGAFIGYLVYSAVTTKYDLVSKDYYKDELRYQDKINSQNNASKISDVKIEQDAEAVIIHLPQEQKGLAISGDVFFYCITDELKDYHTTLQVDSTNRQIVMKKSLQKAAYNVKLNWQQGKETFYFEEKLLIP